MSKIMCLDVSVRVYDARAVHDFLLLSRSCHKHYSQYVGRCVNVLIFFWLFGFRPTTMFIIPVQPHSVDKHRFVRRLIDQNLCYYYARNVLPERHGYRMANIIIN